MAFIDVDEFILPKDGKSISQVTDEILETTDADGLAINLHNFGSNNLEKADYNVGVLERFTRRAVDDWAPLENDIPSGNAAVRIIADPRRIKCFTNPHVPKFLDGCKCVNENGVEVTENFSVPVTADKIVINYYVTKSRAEYAEKVHRRETAKFAKRNELVGFDVNDRNEVIDEEILTYRENLRAERVPKGDALKFFASYTSSVMWEKISSGTSTRTPTSTRLFSCSMPRRVHSSENHSAPARPGATIRYSAARRLPSCSSSSLLPLPSDSICSTRHSKRNSTLSFKYS